MDARYGINNVVKIFTSTQVFNVGIDESIPHHCLEAIEAANLVRESFYQVLVHGGDEMAFVVVAAIRPVVKVPTR
jgi:hypothetical protein